MRIGTDLHHSVLAIAASRANTQADLSLDMHDAAVSGSLAHGNADGLLRRMSWGFVLDSGAAGTVTSRASCGMED